jgi:hypothetical protein
MGSSPEALVYSSTVKRIDILSSKNSARGFVEDIIMRSYYKVTPEMSNPGSHLTKQQE